MIRDCRRIEENCKPPSRFHFSIPKESSILVTGVQDSILNDLRSLFVLQLLNYFFFVVHSMWILLILIGWVHVLTLRIHLYAVVFTAISWICLGYWYGWGYCLCTDWHWQIRSSLGIHDNTNNYVHLLIFKATGLDPSPGTMNILVAGGFAASAVLSIVLNFRRYIKNRKSN